MLLFLISLLLQTPARTVSSQPTGLEWMTIASVVVPAVLIVVIIYLGQRSRV